MRHKMNGDIINFSNSQQILNYLVEDPNKEFLASEIQKATGLSKAGIYRALEELTSRELITRHERGRFVLYKAVSDDCVIRQFKVLKTAIFLKALVERLKPLARKIVLFGSAARGEDSKESDIDLLIVSKDPDGTERIMSGFKSKRKIQAVIKTSSQLAKFEGENKEFINEINSGIILWEERDER